MANRQTITRSTGKQTIKISFSSGCSTSQAFELKLKLTNSEVVPQLILNEEIQPLEAVDAKDATNRRCSTPLPSFLGSNNSAEYATIPLRRLRSCHIKGCNFKSDNLKNIHLHRRTHAPGGRHPRRRDYGKNKPSQVERTDIVEPRLDDTYINLDLNNTYLF